MVPIRLSRPSDEVLLALLDDLAGLNVTYPEVGDTRNSDLPGGYRHDRHSVPLGGGDHAFRRGQEAIRQWQAHHHAGATLTPVDPPLARGTNLVVTLRSGPAFALAPCQIIYVTDEEDLFGFAYGTLPGHPERGEESFHVKRTATGEVSFDIVAFSRPAALLARLGSPVARLVQTRVTQAYLDGVRFFVAGER